MFPKRFLLVTATFLLSLVLYVDRVCISTAEQPICSDLGLSKEQFGWALSAFALGYAVCQAPAGYLADRLGARWVLSSVVVFWSMLTGLTAAARGFVSLLTVRFLFGAGEAGAFPGIARATYSWIPMCERGIVQGINFSGSRLGAALAMPGVAYMIQVIGWRLSFAVLMLIGFVWSVVWWIWFCDDPANHPRIGEGELQYILAQRQQSSASQSTPPLSLRLLAGSRNVWLVSAQYFCSNFTFFFCLSWLFPHIKGRFELSAVAAGMCASAPLICGAVGNWFAGWLIDRIYRSGRWTLSRRVPAMLGYVLAAAGLLASAQAQSPLSFILSFSLAVFGADMTLSPSWSTCIDIGRQHAGLVSGTMNMAGNLGSFVTALAFPYLWKWTGSETPFFYLAAGLNLLALGVWWRIRPDRALGDY